uniref:Uncharacterized protein n=1 Tax=Arundo donax TaxID=35708 RepID=A0A0A9GPG6_ARUDO
MYSWNACIYNSELSTLLSCRLGARHVTRRRG